MSTNRPRIVAAMSGGVDSSVTAALLKRAGYDVVGRDAAALFGRDAEAQRCVCCAGQDIQDAGASPKRLPFRTTCSITRNVPHARDGRLRAGLCARRDADPLRALQRARQVRGPDGHRARTWRRGACDRATMCAAWKGPTARNSIARWDASRDQSYFLFATTQEQLSYLRFPLGDMDKRESACARRRARVSASASKPDSQDICFVPDGKYSNIVERLKPDAAKPGEIVDQEGRVLGAHPRRDPFHRRPAQGDWGLAGNGEPALRAQARRRAGARRRRSARNALYTDHLAARGELAGRRRDRARLRGQGALDAPAGPSARIVRGPGRTAQVELLVPERSGGTRPGLRPSTRRPAARASLGGGWIARAGRGERGRPRASP